MIMQIMNKKFSIGKSSSLNCSYQKAIYNSQIPSLSLPPLPQRYFKNRAQMEDLEHLFFFLTAAIEK